MDDRISLGSRLTHAWDAFRNRDPTYQEGIGSPYYQRPDRTRRRRGNERSIVISVYNRIAIDVAAIAIRHVRTDEEGAYKEDIDSYLNNCLTCEANIDQTGRAFIQDAVMSIFDEGVVAMVPVETSADPDETGSYDIYQLRTAKILEWYPRHIKVSLYNDRTGQHQEIILPKKSVAIVENPLYSVMNEPNSTLQRLIRKLNLLDSIDEQSSSGKLDLIFQLPYVIKSPARRAQAEQRLRDLEDQLAGSKYGIAYTDGTERVTQLNRPAENNLMTQIQYLTSMLYSQLGTTEDVFNGTADEETMLNYTYRSVEPVLSAIVNELERKFLTKTARTQHQAIMYFVNIFRLVPAKELANIGDKFTRNEILSPNEIRELIGKKPSRDPAANELRNRNLNAPDQESLPENKEVDGSEPITKGDKKVAPVNRKENNQNGR